MVLVEVGFAYCTCSHNTMLFIVAERAKELSQTFFKFTTFSKKLKDIGK